LEQVFINTEQRDLLLVPFPFSDQSGRKVRPVIVISNDEFNGTSEDLIVVGVTSNISRDRHTIELSNADLEYGKLFDACCVKIENILKIDKQLNSLDRFVIDFSEILNKLNIKYVFVSGYVSIIFGRNRSSEDIDLIIEKIDLQKFSALWNELVKKFECIITEDKKGAYEEYLLNNHSIRFSEKGKFVPNMEVKFPKMELDTWTLENRKTVVLNGNTIFISPIELQIPFKLFLGSEKDIEDAKHLYNMFKDKLDASLLKEFNKKLKIEEAFKRYLA